MSEEETPQSSEPEPQAPVDLTEAPQEEPTLDDLDWVVTRSHDRGSRDSEQ